jgi:hypothetical protein
MNALPTKVTKEALLARIETTEFILMPDARTTICHLTMTNGFTVRGESACVARDEFDAELGKKYAYDQALDKAWAFEGYLLADKRHEAAKVIKDGMQESCRLAAEAVDFNYSDVDITSQEPFHVVIQFSKNINGVYVKAGVSVGGIVTDQGLADKLAANAVRHAKTWFEKLEGKP